jgi:hypothetical protein
MGVVSGDRIAIAPHNEKDIDQAQLQQSSIIMSMWGARNGLRTHHLFNGIAFTPRRS